ncbi:MAG: transcriptional repressor [Tannerellaceae bacterium]|jgi:Fur family ferric uptake transcriptional regulator|nr:transcriptional repressor [Tannerellaceae bacterium]
MIDSKTYEEIRKSFSAYLTENKLRKTEERYMIFDGICDFPGHFDICALHQKLSNTKFHVSKATLYNTLKVLTDAGLIIRHQLDSKSIQYELKKKAESHLHLVCTQCNCIRDIKNPASLTASIHALKKRFTPEYFSLYVYGICDKCKNKALRAAKKNKIK